MPAMLTTFLPQLITKTVSSSKRTATDLFYVIFSIGEWLSRILRLRDLAEGWRKLKEQWGRRMEAQTQIVEAAGRKALAEATDAELKVSLNAQALAKKNRGKRGKSGQVKCAKRGKSGSVC